MRVRQMKQLLKNPQRQLLRRWLKTM